MSRRREFRSALCGRGGERSLIAGDLRAACERGADDAASLEHLLDYPRGLIPAAAGCGRSNQSKLLEMWLLRGDDTTRDDRADDRRQAPVHERHRCAF